MKVRTGFVSNSSASSFCIYGTVVDDINELLRAVIKNHPDLMKKAMEDNGCTEDEDGYFEDTYGVLEDVFKKLKLKLETPECEDMCWIGNSLANIKDDQTGKEFKQTVSEDLKKLAPDFKFGKLSIIEEACGG